MSRAIYRQDSIVWVQNPERDRFGKITGEPTRTTIKVRVDSKTRVVRNVKGELVQSMSSINLKPSDKPSYDDVLTVDGINYSPILIKEHKAFKSVKSYTVYI